MNYNYLRYFSVLAQVEHYTLAAARLGIFIKNISHLELASRITAFVFDKFIQMMGGTENAAE